MSVDVIVSTACWVPGALFEPAVDIHTLVFSSAPSFHVLLIPVMTPPNGSVLQAL